MSTQIKRKRTPRENELQTAIVTSLQSWCDSNQISCTSMEFYANQQGVGLGRICADFVATLNDSELLLAEVKVHQSGELLAFSDEQFKDDLELELMGLPILYVYNKTEQLAYHQKPKPISYAAETLKAVNYSSPSLLQDAFPCIDKHHNLLGWLKKVPPAGSNITRFAELFGVLRSEALLSNGLMMLIYGTSKVSFLEDLNGAALNKIINTLSHGAAGKYLNKNDQALLESFLKEEATAFSRWYKPNKLTPNSRPRNGGSSSSPSP